MRAFPTSSTAYQQRRKLVGNAFAKSNTVESGPLVAEQIRKFMSWVLKEGTVMNGYAWFRMLLLDIISSILMGQAVGALDSDTEHE